jgi:hypothetical protein
LQLIWWDIDDGSAYLPTAQNYYTMDEINSSIATSAQCGGVHVESGYIYAMVFVDLVPIVLG